MPLDILLPNKWDLLWTVNDKVMLARHNVLFTKQYYMLTRNRFLQDNVMLTRLYICYVQHADYSQVLLYPQDFFGR